MLKDISPQTDIILVIYREDVVYTQPEGPVAKPRQLAHNTNNSNVNSLLNPGLVSPTGCGILEVTTLT